MANFIELVLILLVVFVVVPRMLLRGGQRILHPGDRVDRVRRFSMAEYRQIMNRAGWRCEHHGLLTGRCDVREGLEADHVHPHSRGGATAIHNSQALCAAHNTRKGAKVPFWWNLMALKRRRAGYFRPDEDRGVVRYGLRSTTKRKGRRRK